MKIITRTKWEAMPYPPSFSDAAMEIEAPTLWPFPVRMVLDRGWIYALGPSGWYRTHPDRAEEAS